MTISSLPIAFQNQPNMTKIFASLIGSKKEVVEFCIGDTVRINRNGKTGKIMTITSLFGLIGYNVDNVYYGFEDLTFVSKG